MNADAITAAIRKYVRAELQYERFSNGSMINRISPPKMYDLSFDHAEKEVASALNELTAVLTEVPNV